ncbi:hypothetical protein QWJ26_30555 [Streptomyces sp. CSDS2]|uniref:hypothetical protein n=1 Tax=Streptomyces sp. CSDS2 TaxID=3055051 RepID=UPI0025B1C959|nr:hypothetical protein [Streptomyces sp. CSDS2]MDN3264079.1 hypothetical protein [Streptomyces sp. CSDS2]
MNIRWGGSVWELMLVKRAVGTALSNSASGGYSTLLRDGARNLVGHADLFKGGRAVAGIVVISAAASSALTVATMKVTPRLKTKFRPAAQDTAAEAAEATSDTPVEETGSPGAAATRCLTSGRTSS